MQIVLQKQCTCGNLVRTLAAGKHPADPQQRALARAVVTRDSTLSAAASFPLLQPDTLLQ